MTNMNVTDGQTIQITVTALDAAQQPTTLKGVPAWASSDPATFDPKPSADGLTALGIVNKTGTVTVTVTPDAMMDPHCGPGTISFNANAGDAVTLVLNAVVVPAA